MEEQHLRHFQRQLRWRGGTRPRGVNANVCRVVGPSYLADKGWAVFLGFFECISSNCLNQESVLRWLDDFPSLRLPVSISCHGVICSGLRKG